MSWDDKDWFDITFYEGDEENIKKHLLNMTQRKGIMII